MAEEDTEYIKLPLEDRCVHKLWKARVHGYEEATKLFRQIPDEKSPEWNKFLGLVKKFAADSNAAAQEKGLEAVLAYVESAGPAGKTVGEVMSGIVNKCLAAPKAKTKDLSIQITMMYIEIEKHDAVMDELIKGFDQKNPKVVAACINVATQALREFGNKVINVKPLVKEIPKLLDHRDKIVRDEGKGLIVEVFRWVGVAVKPQLNSLKPVQLTELEAEFEKVTGERAIPNRYLRSQQQRQQQVEEAADNGDDGGGEDEEDGAPAVDPYELVDPVDILSKLPKDFYEKLEAKKWQERKEALDDLEKLLQNPKLESGDYGDLVRALKKIIAKDTNVMIVAMAGKSIASLANGLKKRFQPYALACVSSILEKFRERKQNVVTSMREAIDAVTQIVTLEQIQEDVLEALNNKNPSVKAETAAFLARYFTKCTPQMLDRKMLKAYTPALIKTLNESDPTVRDNSAEALGTAMKVVTEKAIMAYISDVEKLKLDKIKECCEKAVITAKIPKAIRPATAPAKVITSKNTDNKPVPVKRPGASAPIKKPVVKKAVSSAAGKSKAPPKKAAPVQITAERELADEEVDEQVAEMLAPDILAGLVDGNWKIRLAAAEQLLQTINGMEKSEIPSQVLVRTVNKKPGLRDGNFQVLKAKFDVIKALAENSKFTRTTAQFCLQDVADKLGDAKTGTAAADTLTAIAEATKLDFVATEVVTFAFSQKSPRLQQESLLWLSSAIKEFGFVIQPKPVIENIRKSLSSTNVGVRTAGVTLLGTMFLYMGDNLRPLVDGEKPSLMQQINAEFEKHEGQQPPIPIRGMTVSTGDDVTEEAEGDDEGPDPNHLQELLPRTDISGIVTESILNELADKNWKVRDEALQKLAATVNNTKYVTGNLGELPNALTARMQDSNRNIALTAFSLCKHLGPALGTQGKQHLRTLLPSMLQGLGDSKNQIRAIAMECIKTWSDQCGIKELFEGEMIADALKTGNPFLRSELFLWLAENLTDAKGIPKDELVACLPYLFASVEDRNADVRKNSQDAILPFMIHVGYEAMNRQMSKLSPSSRTAVATMLDKARAVLPAKPIATKGKLGQADAARSKPGSAKVAAKPTAAGTVKPKIGGPAKPSAMRGRKEEEQDFSPLLQNNNMKNQRFIDEQKFKVLKWNFTVPREEFIDVLKDQMTAAGINKSLMANMFHSDFKYHLKAIDSLNEFLSVDSAATTSNLDLILKWLTLRFFDTNPSVLLRGLEYLHSVFVMLAEDGYNMMEIEAASFVPYLILKSGDPKDTVRSSVRAIMQQITLVYSCSKLFAYVMEGLKSKNSRQRTECLEELGTLIENYGISVCQPTPASALKEIARQISDRDNSVRTAALNCVVQAWYQEGDRVYKMIGAISDKDMSLLTERIKRAGKNRPIIRTAPEPISKPTKVVRPNVVSQEQSMKEIDRYQDEEVEINYRSEDVAVALLQTKSPSSESATLAPHNRNFDLDAMEPPAEIIEPNVMMRAPRPISGKFCLDYNMLDEMEDPKALRAPNLVEMDLQTIIESDVHLPIVDQPKLQVVNSPVGGGSTVAAAAELYVGRLCNHQLERSTEACREVEAMLRRESSLRVLFPLTDQLLVAITNQLQLLHKASHETHDLQHMSSNYTLLITILRVIFAMPDMASRASQSVIRDLMSSLLSMLVEQKLERFPTEEQITRLTNSLVVRIIENSEHTKLVNAQLRMLYECIATPTTHPKFTELVTKSLWKVMRIIESWGDTLDFAAVLKEINHFLADFPSSTWRDRSNLVPLKTVKTLVHSMVQMKGAALLTYIGKDEMCSELNKIINKCIAANTKPTEKTQNNTAKDGMSPHRVSKLTHQQLSIIFKKIGSKDQTREGLEQLYDFQKLHPDEDIAPFLERASMFFQDYVKKGLTNIEKERIRHSSNTASSLSSPQVMADTPSDSGSECALYMRTAIGKEEETGEDSAQYYKERLKELHNKAGLGSKLTSTEDQHSIDNHSNDVNCNRRPLGEILDTIPRSIPGETSPPKSTDMEKLLQRLERFKR